MDLIVSQDEVSLEANRVRHPDERDIGVRGPTKLDSILYRNEVSLGANRVSHTDGKDTGTLGPTLSSRALAIVHLAMYDAYAGVANDPANLPPI